MSRTHKILGNIVMVLLTLVVSQLVLSSIGMRIVSPMMFDAPGSEDSPVVMFLFGFIFVYPFVSLFGIIKGRRKWLRHQSLKYGILWISLGLFLALVAVTLFQSGTIDF